MALKIYGIPRSRAFRILWMAKELGLDYENVPINFANGGTRTPEYLRINPNGHVPAIDDDGVILWESMAINLYLAKKHAAGSLYPARPEGEARAWQWSFWGMTEVERPRESVRRARLTGGQVTRRRALGIGIGGAAALAVAPRPAIGGKAMAQTTPDTVVYVSNAGGPEIHVLAMNRVTGDLDLIDKVA